MREWQVGDPFGDGNDIGVPDTKYMSYLKNSIDYDPSNSINNSKQYRQRAWNAYEDNRSKDALKYINKAIDINPHDEENWNIKGIILTDLYRKNGFYEPNDVKRCYNKALEINPNNNIIKLNKAIFLTFRAREWYEEEMYGIAKQEINEALDLIEDKSSDDYAIALNIKGNILLKEWDFDESLKCYNQALEIMPEYSVINDNIKSLKKNKHLYDRGVLQYFDQGWSDNIELSKDDNILNPKPNKSQVYIDPPTIIPLDEEDNLSNILSKTKSLDEMEDEYWNLVEEKKIAII